jgi:ferredoxin
LELNRKFADEWPNITAKKDQPSDADEFRDVKDKYEKYFSDKPGTGD